MQSVLFQKQMVIENGNVRIYTKNPMLQKSHFNQNKSLNLNSIKTDEKSDQYLQETNKQILTLTCKYTQSVS